MGAGHAFAQWQALAEFGNGLLPCCDLRHRCRRQEPIPQSPLPQDRGHRTEQLKDTPWAEQGESGGEKAAGGCRRHGAGTQPGPAIADAGQAPFVPADAQPAALLGFQDAVVKGSGHPEGCDRQ